MLILFTHVPLATAELTTRLHEIRGVQKPRGQAGTQQHQLLTETRRWILEPGCYGLAYVSMFHRITSTNAV